MGYDRLFDISYRVAEKPGNPHSTERWDDETGGWGQILHAKAEPLFPISSRRQRRQTNDKDPGLGPLDNDGGNKTIVNHKPCEEGMARISPFTSF